MGTGQIQNGRLRDSCFLLLGVWDSRALTDFVASSELGASDP